MRRIGFAFLDVGFAFLDGGTLLSKTLKNVTDGRFSHCSIIMENNDGVFESNGHDPRHSGVINVPHIYSAHLNAKDGAEVIWLYTTDEKYQKILDFLKGELGSGYDYRGALSFIFSSIKAHPDKWWCSELNYHVMCVIAGVEPSDRLVSPQDVYYMASWYSLGKETKGLDAA